MAENSMLKRAFDQLAEDSDVIDIPRFKKLLQSNLIPIHHPFVVAVFDRLDGTETFNYKEVCKNFRNIKANVEDPVPSLEAALEMFMFNDQNGDGFISKEELMMLVREISTQMELSLTEEGLDAVAAGMIECSDTNNDGKLNYLEYLQFLKSVDVELVDIETV